MPNLKFNVQVIIDNPGALPELQYRMHDLQPAFEQIYQEWVQINAQKFELAVGREAGGAQVFEEFWAGLSGGYMKQKHGMGTAKVTKKAARGGAQFAVAFPDWIMVRTGALREAMTNPESMFHDIGPEQAVFGTPNDPELADIVKWQAGKRNVIFLALPDMNAIRRNLQEYLAMGGRFTQPRSGGAAALEKEVEAMDAEFKSEVDE